MTNRSSPSTFNSNLSEDKECVESPACKRRRRDDDDDDDAEEEKESYESECPICLEPLQLPVRLMCTHVYCFLCAKGLMVKGMLSCALCRAPVDKDYVNKLTMEDVIQMGSSDKKGLNENEVNDNHQNEVKDNHQNEVNDSHQSNDDQNEAMVWYYSGRGGHSSWWRFSSRHSRVLEAAYRKDPLGHLKLVICGNTYVIDFKTSLQYSQSSPQACRRIKRDRAHASCKGEAGLKAIQ